MVFDFYFDGVTVKTGNREPDADGKFEDCAEEVLHELIQQNESDDEE